LEVQKRLLLIFFFLYFTISRNILRLCNISSLLFSILCRESINWIIVKTHKKELFSLSYSFQETFWDFATFLVHVEILSSGKVSKLETHEKELDRFVVTYFDWPAEWTCHIFREKKLFQTSRKLLQTNKVLVNTRTLLSFH
jgi:hypothetical protein